MSVPAGLATSSLITTPTAAAASSHPPPGLVVPPVVPPPVRSIGPPPAIRPGENGFAETVVCLTYATPNSSGDSTMDWLSPAVLG